ncbi:MAG: VOC family protein [Candidatus Limnocylindrus sp.]
MANTNPCLWFDGTAEQAANLYVSVFPNSSIDEVVRTPGDYHAGTAGSVLAVRFTLNGAPFLALNGGPMYQFTPAVSFQIDCADQAEVDRYWAALTEGGEPGQCGWLKDRFGLSWQVNPREMNLYLGGADRAGAARAQQAMMKMEKLIVEDLRRAYEGE